MSARDIVLVVIDRLRVRIGKEVKDRIRDLGYLE
jgi:hypothetical protein